MTATDYTPDDAMVREAYIQFMFEPGDPANTLDRHDSAFDRWLTARDVAKQRAAIVDNLAAFATFAYRHHITYDADAMARHAARIAREGMTDAPE